MIDCILFFEKKNGVVQIEEENRGTEYDRQREKERGSGQGKKLK